MKLFLGIVTAILGIAAIVTMFLTVSAGVSTFWIVAHIVAGVVLIADSIYLIRDRRVVAHPEDYPLDTPRI